MTTGKTGLTIITTLAAATLSGPALAEGGKSAGDLMVRARVISVQPALDSTITLIDGKVDISNAVVPELDFTYFLTDNIAAELILATTKHDVEAKGTTLGNVDVGSVWLLPPTLTMQYHFMTDEKFSPYVGVGVNYTLFYNEEVPGTTVTSVDYDNAFGFLLQGGIDVHLKDNWYANLDVKKLFLKTDAALNGGAIVADVDINPWVIGLGVGYKF